jgi:hypothetical protein
LASIFPPSPIVGDYFTSNNTTWQWNGEAWVVLPAEGKTFKNIVTSPSTEIVVADSGADTLNLIAGENISISANSSTDSITINSTGNYTSVNSISTPDYIQFDTTANTNPVTGLMGWDSVEGTLNLGLSSGKHIHLGEESVFRVRNSTGSTIGKGTALYASGVEPSGRIQVTPYVANGSVREVRFMGLATESISSGVNGFVQHFGYVRDLDTRGTSSTSISVGDETWAAGDLLYVHPTVPGKLTNVKPQHEIVVAIIIIRHQSTGILFVRPTSGGHLEDIHDISLSSLSNEDILIYNSASSLWVNTPLTTTNVLEGSNLYFTNQRAIDAIGGTLGTASAAILIEAEDYTDDTISNLFIHENHTNLTAEYNGASTQIILRSSGGTPLYGFNAPEIEGIDQQIYYQINSASTAIIDIFQYVNNEWIELNTPVNNWNYTLDENWQWVLNNGDWELLYEGPGLYNASAITFDSEYLPNLVAEIVYLSKSAASATYLPYATASTLYLLKSGGVINGELDVIGNFTNAGSVATFDVEHFHLNNNIISLNMGASGEYLDSGIEIYRGASASKVKLAFDETIDKWVFTNDGTNFNELGSGGGALLFQDSQPDTLDLDPGTVWIDSNEDVGSGFDIASFVRWQKTLSASATTISGLDDNSLSLLYTPEIENVYVNGTLLARGEDYIGSSGSAIVLTEAAVSGDIIEIHIFESFSIADAYTKTQSDAKYLSISSSTSFEPNIAYVSASPSAPTAGTLWIDSTNSAAPSLKVYNGSTWIAVSGASEAGLHPFFTAGI